MLSIRIVNAIDNISLPNGWKVVWEVKGDNYFIAIEAKDAIDNVTGKTITWKSRKWYISEFATDAEIVQTIFKAGMTALEHEFRETFLYKGMSVFDPHYDLDRLVELRSKPDALSERVDNTQTFNPQDNRKYGVHSKPKIKVRANPLLGDMVVGSAYPVDGPND